LQDLDAFSTLGHNRAGVESSLRKIVSDGVIPRIWSRDHTVWKAEPTDISDRLGWLDLPRTMRQKVSAMSEAVDRVKSSGFEYVLLLGMGGSSLAPWVFGKIFATPGEHLVLEVLDTTDPSTIMAVEARLDLRHTLVIVSSKSGETIETRSLTNYFYARLAETVGRENVGQHFIAVTDPGSELASLAAKNKFRETIFNESNVGGRYSALSQDGLFPAALIGVDVQRLLDQACEAAERCGPGHDVSENPGACLGVILGELGLRGYDKLTLVLSPTLLPFGTWLEQLVAESTGKDRRGILPIVHGSLGDPSVYGRDRLFVSISLAGDEDAENQAALAALSRAGHPVVRILLRDVYELGRQFFTWEMAISVACYLLGVNPFDQPDVESSKGLTRSIVAAYRNNHALPEIQPTLVSDSLIVYGWHGESLPVLLHDFLAARPGDYIAVQAYVHQTEETDRALSRLRDLLVARNGVASTADYGPRLLHSTGQLHKGGGGRGHFIQITSDDVVDLDIPDDPGSFRASVTFGVLKEAQARGDRQALLEAGKPVIRVHARRKVSEAIEELSLALQELRIPAR
jgi:transaldolase/glucose-6-phosphate isomerase